MVAKGNEQRPLRLWPGVMIIVAQLLLQFAVPAIAPEAMVIGIFAGVVAWLTVIIWWAFFSRAAKSERWMAIVLMVVTMLVTKFFLHESISKAGMGIMYFVLVTPALSIAFIISVLIGSRFSDRLRRILMGIAIFIVCGMFTLIQTGGLDAEFNHDLSWRWLKSPEQLLLAQSEDESMLASSISDAGEAGPEWPGFRGPLRDGIVRGVRIKTDWNVSPPVEMWRRPVGPGWSSFAVHGKLFFTQEQRGENEAVTCYNILTGEPVWRHIDAARFWESNGGAGPRGTPTLHNGRVYTLGGTGILNVLNAADGSVIWSRNTEVDTETKVPVWAYSGSPLIVDDLVIVGVSGALAAYDIDVGEPRWSGPKSTEGYSSPQLMNIDGVDQVLFINGSGIISVLPNDGSLLWKYAWKGYPIVQPALTADGGILVSVDDRNGIRRIDVTREADAWTVEERWASKKIKPYFNDSAIHKGHVYGYGSRSLACIDVTDGTYMWKGGRYGRGQFILLADQDLIIVLSEKGELALVEALPGQFTELAKIPAIEGKTWNHPVLVGDVLLVRNASEMVAYRLALTGS
ncbi:PQQ-binding-like beta-propeller repeat protein [bacterium]|nr:PQQ-binding-like beta-propeller repeat protein [bacterium]